MARYLNRFRDMIFKLKLPIILYEMKFHKKKKDKLYFSSCSVESSFLDKQNVFPQFVFNIKDHLIPLMNDFQQGCLFFPVSVCLPLICLPPDTKKVDAVTRPPHLSMFQKFLSGVLTASTWVRQLIVKQISWFCLRYLNYDGWTLRNETCI